MIFADFKAECNLVLRRFILKLAANKKMCHSFAGRHILDVSNKHEPVKIFILLDVRFDILVQCAWTW